jgi:hypothetical protein
MEVSNCDLLRVKAKKVKLLMCLTKHHAMKTYEGVEVQLHRPMPQTEESGQLHAPATLPPGKEPLVPIC